MIGNIVTIDYGLTTLGLGTGIGLIGMKNQEAMARQSELKGYLRVNMFLSITFAEALGLLGFVVGFALGPWS